MRVQVYEQIQADHRMANNSILNGLAEEIEGTSNPHEQSPAVN